MDLVFFDIFQAEIGQLGDPNASLEEDFDDSADSQIQPDGVAEIFDFGGGEDMGREDIVFGVGEGMGGVLGNQILAVEEFEEGFEGIDLS